VWGGKIAKSSMVKKRDTNLVMATGESLARLRQAIYIS